MPVPEPLFGTRNRPSTVWPGTAGAPPLSHIVTVTRYAPVFRNRNRALFTSCAQTGGFTSVASTAVVPKISSVQPWPRLCPDPRFR